MLLPRIKIIQPPTPGPDPQISLTIDIQLFDMVIADAVGVLPIEIKGAKRISVITVQSRIGPEPQKPRTILANAGHRVLRQALFGGQMFEFDHFLAPCRQVSVRQQKQNCYEFIWISGKLPIHRSMYIIIQTCYLSLGVR